MVLGFLSSYAAILNTSQPSPKLFNPGPYLGELGFPQPRIPILYRGSIPTPGFLENISKERNSGQAVKVEPVMQVREEPVSEI